MCHPAWARARVAAQRLSDLTRLRRVRDRISREHTRPLDLDALARGVDMSAADLNREFRLAYGESPHAYAMRRRIERVIVLLLRHDVSGPAPLIHRRDSDAPTSGLTLALTVPAER